MYTYTYISSTSNNIYIYTYETGGERDKKNIKNIDSLKDNNF